MQPFKFDANRVHPAYRKAAKAASARSFGLCVAVLCFFFACILILTMAPRRTEASLPTDDPGSAFAAKAVKFVQHFTKVISAGNSKTVARLQHFVIQHIKNAKPHVYLGSAHLHPLANVSTIETVTIVPPPVRHERIVNRIALIRVQTPQVVIPAQPPALVVVPQQVHHSGGYVNYDVLASQRSLYGIFGYGRRIGNGVAQVGFLARAAGDDARGVVLTGAAWQRHSDVSGSTLTIGDAESYRGKYEESVRFDGVQYSTPKIAYALGFERTDFPDSAMHFGSLMAEFTANRAITKRLTGQAHFFADKSTALVGIGATWQTPGFGQLQVGLAPARGRGLTGYFGYSLNTPRFRLALDDRVWGGESFTIGQLEPSNFRTVRTAVEYNTTPNDAIRVAFGSQAQGRFSTRTMSAGYVKRVGAAEMHVDLVTSATGQRRNAGLATYISVPLGGNRTVVEQHSLQGSSPSSTATLRQDLPDSGAGIGYAINMGEGSGAFQDATLSMRSAGSTTQLEMSRYGGPLSWSAEFSGAVVFLDGRLLGTNQTIDQSSAYDALKGRTSVSLTIVAVNGDPVPAGAVVRAIGEGGTWRVDADGRVEIDDIAAGPQTFIITLPSGECVIGVVAPPAVANTYELGKQVCARAR